MPNIFDHLMAKAADELYDKAIGDKLGKAIEHYETENPEFWYNFPGNIVISTDALLETTYKSSYEELKKSLIGDKSFDEALLDGITKARSGMNHAGDIFQTYLAAKNMEYLTEKLSERDAKLEATLSKSGVIDSVKRYVECLHLTAEALYEENSSKVIADMERYFAEHKAEANEFASAVKNSFKTICDYFTVFWQERVSEDKNLKNFFFKEWDEQTTRDFANVINKSFSNLQEQLSRTAAVKNINTFFGKANEWAEKTAIKGSLAALDKLSDRFVDMLSTKWSDATAMEIILREPNMQADYLPSQYYFYKSMQNMLDKNLKEGSFLEKATKKSPLYKALNTFCSELRKECEKRKYPVVEPDKYYSIISSVRKKDLEGLTIEQKNQIINVEMNIRCMKRTVNSLTDGLKTISKVITDKEKKTGEKGKEAASILQQSVRDAKTQLVDAKWKRELGAALNMVSNSVFRNEKNELTGKLGDIYVSITKNGYEFKNEKNMKMDPPYHNDLVQKLLRTADEVALNHGKPQLSPSKKSYRIPEPKAEKTKAEKKLEQELDRITKNKFQLTNGNIAYNIRSYIVEVTEKGYIFRNHATMGEVFPDVDAKHIDDLLYAEEKIGRDCSQLEITCNHNEELRRFYNLDQEPAHEPSAEHLPDREFEQEYEDNDYPDLENDEHEQELSNLP